MGRKAKPINLHLVTGNKSHLTKKQIEQRKKNEPKFNADKIRCPAWLKTDPVAKKEWNRITKELKAAELITNVDVTALAVYCDTYSKYIEATEELNKTDLTLVYTNKFGAENIIEHPLVRISRGYAELMKKYITEFGLTPASRAKIAIPKKEKEEDPLKQKGFGNV